MARGINKVILVGNLGQDPETRAMPSGKAVTNVRIATRDSWRDKQRGEQKEKTEWHTVVFFDRLAEIAAEYLRKGSQVYVEGRLRTRKWQDKSGQCAGEGLLIGIAHHRPRAVVNLCIPRQAGVSMIARASGVATPRKLHTNRRTLW